MQHAILAVELNVKRPQASLCGTNSESKARSTLPRFRLENTSTPLWIHVASTLLQRFRAAKTEKLGNSGAVFESEQAETETCGHDDKDTYNRLLIGSFRSEPSLH